MTPRVKLLAFGLLGVVVLWQGGGVIQETFLGPLDHLDAQVRQLDASILAKETTRAQILKATRDLKGWTDRSLPSNRVTAATLYQAWLINLAEKCKLSQVSVSTADRGDTRLVLDTYAPVRASIKAEGTLSQVCDFLHAYHTSGLLHRVNSMKLGTTRHQGDPTLNIELQVEGLALQRAENRTTRLESDNLKPRELTARSEYDKRVVQKNLFVRGYNGPPAPPRRVEPPRVTPMPPAEPPFDSKEFTKLVASWKADGRRESWLYDQSSNTRTVLTEGSRFKVADLEGICLAIGDDFVRLQIARETYLLTLGQSLKEMRKLPTTAQAAPSETAPEKTVEPQPAEPKSPEPAKPQAAVESDTEPAGGM